MSMCRGSIRCDYRLIVSVFVKKSEPPFRAADDEIHPGSFKELPMMNQQGFVFVFSIIVETWRMWVQKSSGRCEWYWMMLSCKGGAEWNIHLFLGKKATRNAPNHSRTWLKFLVLMNDQKPPTRARQQKVKRNKDPKSAPTFPKGNYIVNFDPLGIRGYILSQHVVYIHRSRGV